MDAREAAAFAAKLTNPSPAMLRPFMGCPDDELDLAWAAMVSIATAEIRREAEGK